MGKKNAANADAGAAASPAAAATANGSVHSAPEPTQRSGSGSGSSSAVLPLIFGVFLGQLLAGGACIALVATGAFESSPLLDVLNVVRPVLGVTPGGGAAAASCKALAEAAFGADAEAAKKVPTLEAEVAELTKKLKFEQKSAKQAQSKTSGADSAADKKVLALEAEVADLTKKSAAYQQSAKQGTTAEKNVAELKQTLEAAKKAWETERAEMLAKMQKLANPTKFTAAQAAFAVLESDPLAACDEGKVTKHCPGLHEAARTWYYGIKQLAEALVGHPLQANLGTLSDGYIAQIAGDTAGLLSVPASESTLPDIYATVAHNNRQVMNFARSMLQDATLQAGGPLDASDETVPLPARGFLCKEEC